VLLRVEPLSRRASRRGWAASTEPWACDVGVRIREATAAVTSTRSRTTSSRWPQARSSTLCESTSHSWGTIQCHPSAA